MSAFQIDLQHLEGKSVEKDLQPSPETLEKLFAGIGEDFRLSSPEGFSAHIRAQMSDSTVHVVGEAHGEFTYKCGRCLAERPLEVDADIDFVLMSEAEWSSAYAGKEEIALNAEDLDVSYYSGDTIDIGELIREALLLELPAFPHCPPEAAEECDARYQKRVGAEALDELEENKVDLRWSALKDIEISEDGKVRKIERNKDTD
jgi:uncharacterized protein